jgi:hypothetical protein
MQQLKRNGANYLTTHPTIWLLYLTLEREKDLLLMTDPSPKILFHQLCRQSLAEMQGLTEFLILFQALKFEQNDDLYHYYTDKISKNMFSVFLIDFNGEPSECLVVPQQTHHLWAFDHFQQNPF